MPAMTDLPATAPLDVTPASIPGDARLLDHRTRSLAIPAALALPGAYLAVEAGNTRLLIELKRGVTHVGRGLSADIRLEDQRVSRLHALILRSDDHVVLLDDRSLSGTFVNGQRVQQAQLHDDDAIGVGPVVLRYVEVARQRQDAPIPVTKRDRTRRSRRAPNGPLTRRMGPAREPERITAGACAAS